MSIVNTQIAYILHQRAYRETSSILELVTKDFGRVSLMARGCRGKRSKIAGNLMLFTPLLVSWQGRGELPYLKSIERADLKAPVLKKKSLLCAIYINELLMFFLHKHDVQEIIFEQYHHCLYALANDNNLEITLRKFELKLLELLGFGVNLHSEADTGDKILADEIYHYYVEHGLVKSRDGMPTDGRYVARSQDGGATKAVYAPKISGNCLLALSGEQFQIIAENKRYLAELKQLMRFVINHHLGNKKLKSRELFKPVG